MRSFSLPRAGLVALAIGATVTLSACAGGTGPGSAAPASSPATDTATRVALSYPGGILVLDGQSLEPWAISRPRSSPA